MQNRNLTLLTWNVNGLCNKTERGQILKALARYKPDFVFLQETHMIDNQHDRLGKGKFRAACHAQYTTGSRGVLILVKKTLAFQVTRTWKDKWAATQRYRGNGKERQ